MPSPSKVRRRQRGFTLVELLVVIVILGLLIGIVAPRAIDFLSRAKADVARIQIENLATALEWFRVDNGRYPTTEEGLDVLIKRPVGLTRWRGPYLKGDKVPLDPWTRPYVYEAPGSGGKAYGLLSLGEDGRKGGDGDNADITN
ncbi:MAG: type II secretion system protein GspG [Alphaproteobacteria bacterium]|nr:type II secretion system protein GspG [Alphaproteobacteria bacterium]